MAFIKQREAVQDSPLTPEAKAYIVDKAVREARSRGYCSEFSDALHAVFPEGPTDGDDWYDSEGINCKGERWRDRDGYDKEGYDRQGFNREGFDRDGYNKAGLNAVGLDRNGLSADDPQRYRYDRRGMDVNGYNAEGLDRNGLTHEQRVQECIYDRYGYDKDGYNREGYNRQGQYAPRKRLSIY